MSELTQPVVVTARELEKILTFHEGLEGATPLEVEDADVTTAMANIFGELRRAEAKAEAPVLTTPHGGPWAGPAARLQSLVASGQVSGAKFMPLPTGGLEAQFDTGDWLGWASVVWEKLKHLKKHEMVRPNSIAEPFPKEGRIAVVGDWGTGLYGAPEIAKAIRNDPNPFAMLIHLGDVYYSGTETEVQQRFLGLWPTRSGAINRALNSNHEMYSGGDAYFDKILPKFNQEGSYFACQNEHWTLIGLDVAYQDHSIDDEQVMWMEQVLRKADHRKVILFSHHQLYSHFESQGTKLIGHPRFGDILRSNRIFAWYWGHEHHCLIFEEPDKNFGLWGRCFGHGGMPESRARTRNLARVSGKTYERAEWRRSPAMCVNGLDLPSLIVLEGPNPYIKGESDKFTPHGYAVLTLDGPILKEQVLKPDGTVVYEKTLVP